jgi:hypothetical protein
MSAVPRVVPVEGRIDGDQLRAMLGLLLGQGFRPGLDRSSGVKGDPRRQLLLSMGLMGVFFTPHLWRATDLSAGLVLLYAGVTVLVLLAIVPETQEARERHVEILGSKPLARRTVFAARGAMLAVLGTVIAAAFGLVPLVAAKLRFGASWARLSVAYLGLVLSAFVAAVAALVLVTLALRVWSPDRVRRVSQNSLVFLMLGLWVSSLLTVPQLFSGGLLRYRFAGAGGALEWLPSTWMARLAAGGSPHPMLHAAGTVAMVGAAVVLGLGGGLERFLPSFVETVPSPEPRSRDPLGCRVLRLLARAPVLRDRWLTAPAAAVAETAIRSARAEDLTRVRSTTQHVMGLGVFVLAFTGDFSLVAHSLLLFLAVGGAIEAARLVRQSTSPEASWLFRAAPLRGADLLHGIEATVLLGNGLPLVLLAVLTARDRAPAVAVLLIVGYVLAAIGLVAATVAVDPALPLAREATVSSFGGIVAGLFAGVALVTAFQVAIYLAEALGAFGLVLLVLMDLGLAVAAWTAAKVAAVRLDGALAE